MLPSRGPVQVDVDAQSCDTVSEQVKPQMTQVKILRRPRPAPTIDSSQSELREFNKLVYNEHKNLTTQTAATATTTTASTSLDHEWPTLADASKSCHRSQATKNTSINIKSRNVNANKVEPPLININQQQKSSVMSNKVMKLTNPQPPLMLKSYQERADEYAKARLRIFGIASSDDDNNN